MQGWHVGATLFDARESPKIDDFFGLERNGIYTGWFILFSPLFEEDSHFDEHIFQRG